ncbi:MAG: hypothetical protein QXH30_01610 [Candidatus Bilamarchaeaceae archaeon]
MEAQPIILSIVFILVAASLAYVVLNINTAPISYEFAPQNVSISADYAGECALGQEKRCTISGCAGVIKCSYGRWTECKIEKECSKGEARPCPYGCSEGIQECGECGKWGPCMPIPLPAGTACGSSEACNFPQA